MGLALQRSLDQEETHPQTSNALRLAEQNSFSHGLDAMLLETNTNSQGGSGEQTSDHK